MQTVKPYYETLQVLPTATQIQIKQSYKRLALIHHPDKNKGSPQSQHRFREISEAYTVLNDPKKRENYDRYGVADLEGIDLEGFMGSFEGFEDFLEEVLSFNTFDAMFTGVNKKKGKKGAKVGGRAKGRQKGVSNKEMEELMQMMMGNTMESSIQMAMLQAMMEGGMVDQKYIEQMEKQIQKMALQSDEDQDEDEQDLTQQQMQILTFGQKNIEKKKVGKKKKKTEIKCKLDGQVIQQDEILMHFSENHMKQFKQYQQQQKNKTGQYKTQSKPTASTNPNQNPKQNQNKKQKQNQNSSKNRNKKSKQEQQQIQY